jgi:bile acid-coenzyme A ligase
MTTAPESTALQGKTFCARLIELAELDPSRPAVTCEGTALTRGEFVAGVRRLAGYLREQGVDEGSMVTLGLANSAELVQSLFAVWWLGATPQCISHRLPAGERAAIVELADPALVIGVAPDEVGGRLALTLDQIRDAIAAGPDPGEPVAISPIWKVMTSGGSTGRPKLIVATAPAEPAAVMEFAHLLALPANGNLCVTGPLTHNSPFVITAIGLLRGNHVVLMPKFDASRTLELVETHGVDWLYLVPTMMLRIWRLPEAERLGRDLTSLRTVYHMAAPCPPWLKEAWIDWLGGEVIWELYGGTETQAITVITGTEWLARQGSVGRPVLGEIQARDDAGAPLAPGDVGELWMRRGAGQPSPYQYIGATPRAAADGWESLGDIGYLDADGFVYLTDRRADMIVVGGSNVYPAEVEAALDEHPAVRSCCVIGLPHEDLGHVPHAVVELAEPVSDEDLIAHVRARIAPYKLPRSIERVTEPLRDDAGKVRRSALQAARTGAGQV